MTDPTAALRAALVAAVGREPLQTPLRTVNPRVLHYSEERKRADLDDDPGYEPERVDSVTGYPVQPMPWGIR